MKLLFELLEPRREPTAAEMIQQRMEYRAETIRQGETAIADTHRLLDQVRIVQAADQETLDLLLDAQATQEARAARERVNGHTASFADIMRLKKEAAAQAEREAEKVQEHPVPHYEDPLPTGFQDLPSLLVDEGHAPGENPS